MRRMNIKKRKTNRKKTIIKKRFRLAVFIAAFLAIALTVFRYFKFVSETVYRMTTAELPTGRNV